MPPLAEFQRRMAADILGEPVPRAPGGLEIHRGTVLGGLVNALRLAFPTVVKLTGEREPKEEDQRGQHGDKARRLQLEAPT